jgi:hypothetical protein
LYPPTSLIDPERNRPKDESLKVTLHNFMPCTSSKRNDRSQI